LTLERDDGAVESFELVFPEEADASAGLLSISSPLGRALLNREVGDDIEVATPKGKRTYSVVGIETLHERGDGVR
jgi:transcription elongation GreA/GreB family factor